MLIYLNGVILRMRRAEIARKFGEIVKRLSGEIRDSMHRGLRRAWGARGVEVLTVVEAGMLEREGQEYPE